MKKALLFGLGLVVIAGAVLGGSLVRSVVRLETDAPPAPTLLEVSRLALAVGGPRGRGAAQRFSVRIVCPAEILEDESPTVELRFELAGNPDGEAPEPSPMTAEVELSSATFKIVPSPRISRSGTPPFVYTWVVTPQSLGRHALLVDIAQLLDRDSIDVLEDVVTLNGKALATANATSLALPVRVLTEWGISGRTFNLLRAAVGLLGFILTYPLWIQWVRRLLGWKE